MTNQSIVSLERIKKDLRYLKLLSRSFPTIATASTELINLRSIINLPKGTEHFLSDLHGENEAFQHVLKNASGTVRRKVVEIFGHTLMKKDITDICTLIYYPSERIRMMKEKRVNLDDWYRIKLNQLVRVCQSVSSKYTRSKVRKALPAEFSYIIQELLHETQDIPNKVAYINEIISAIVSTQRSDDFIIAMCHLIQRLVIDSLHIVGDIYDRGPGAHLIMDTLCEYHTFDIQWGNHDLLWIGAVAGNRVSIANVLRVSLRYGNTPTLEDGYGINLLPLATFAMETYVNDPCEMFLPKVNQENKRYDEKTIYLTAQMHKAIAIIQFKLEAEIIKRRAEFEMEDRLLLDKIDFEKGLFIYEGKTYEMNDHSFPTVDPADPYKLTEEEKELMDKLYLSFLGSEKLNKHVQLLFSHGSMYLVQNQNLLFHASMPMNKDGSFKHIRIQGKEYWGKSLLDEVDQLCRTAYFKDEDDAEDYKSFALDYVWYLWCGKDAPSFDKDKMTTFERYFVKDKSLQKEKKGAYYFYRDNEDTCNMILDEFGITGPQRHIINGHVPVKTSSGESPLKAKGKLIVIDGGFSKAYQPTTGIAGYTLVYNSHGLELVQHEPFKSRDLAIKEGLEIKSTSSVIEFVNERMLVRDTDKGEFLLTQIEDLNKLLTAYRSGLIKERR